VRPREAASAAARATEIATAAKTVQAAETDSDAVAPDEAQTTAARLAGLMAAAIRGAVELKAAWDGAPLAVGPVDRVWNRRPSCSRSEANATAAK
jgi:hypothetical protein